jgi:hypothetical protein
MTRDHERLASESGRKLSPSLPCWNRGDRKMAERFDGWNVLPGGKALPSYSLSLTDFPLGDLAGQSIVVYRTGTGRLHSAAAPKEEYPARVADFLEDRDHFNLPQEWLEAMADTGEPHRAAAIVREAMTHWEALKDPSLGKRLDSMLRAAVACGTAYLDGLRVRGEDAMLVIAEDHVSPIPYFSPVHGLQWDVFDSAASSLRPDHPDDDALDVRVALVPRLWGQALNDSRRSRRGYLVLAEALEGYPHTSQTCAAVAAAIARKCHAGLFVGP